MTAEFLPKKKAQVEKAAERSLHDLRRFEATYHSLYSEGVFWKQASSQWEADCGKWSDLAAERAVEVSALREKLDIVGQVSSSLEQESAEQKRELSDSWRNYAAVKAERDVLKKELATMREGFSQLEASVQEQRKLLASSEATLEQRKEELLEAKQLAAETKATLSGRELLLQDAISEVRRVTAELQRVSAEAASSADQRSQEMESLRLQSEERLKTAVEEYKASSDFAGELNESGAFSYGVGFDDALAEVEKSFPDIDLSGIAPPAGGEAGDDVAPG